MASMSLEPRFVHRGVLGEIRERTDLGQHAQHLLERAHFADLAQLVAKILEHVNSLRRSLRSSSAAFL